MFRSTTLIVLIAAIASAGTTNAFSVNPNTSTSSSTALFASSAGSSKASLTKKTTTDEQDKAFLTHQFTTNSPPVFPDFVVDGHHPAPFESDGGIMMKEHLDEAPTHAFEKGTLAAVSESTAKKIGPVVDHHLPPFYYFD